MSVARCSMGVAMMCGCSYDVLWVWLRCSVGVAMMFCGCGYAVLWICL